MGCSVQVLTLCFFGLFEDGHLPLSCSVSRVHVCKGRLEAVACILQGADLSVGCLCACNPAVRVAAAERVNTFYIWTVHTLKQSRL